MSTMMCDWPDVMCDRCLVLWREDVLGRNCWACGRFGKDFRPTLHGDHLLFRFLQQ